MDTSSANNQQPRGGQNARQNSVNEIVGYPNGPQTNRNQNAQQSRTNNPENSQPNATANVTSAETSHPPSVPLPSSTQPSNLHPSPPTSKVYPGHYRHFSITRQLAKAGPPFFFLLWFVICGIVVLVYNYGSHKPIPARFLTGLLISFGTIATMWIICLMCLLLTSKRKLPDDEEKRVSRSGSENINSVCNLFKRSWRGEANQVREHAMEVAGRNGLGGMPDGGGEGRAGNRAGEAAPPAETAGNPEAGQAIPPSDQLPIRRGRRGGSNELSVAHSLLEDYKREEDRKELIKHREEQDEEILRDFIQYRNMKTNHEVPHLHTEYQVIKITGNLESHQLSEFETETTARTRAYGPESSGLNVSKLRRLPATGQESRPIPKYDRMIVARCCEQRMPRDVCSPAFDRQLNKNELDSEELETDDTEFQELDQEQSEHENPENESESTQYLRRNNEELQNESTSTPLSSRSSLPSLSSNRTRRTWPPSPYVSEEDDEPTSDIDLAVPDSLGHFHRISLVSEEAREIVMGVRTVPSAPSVAEHPPHLSLPTCMTLRSSLFSGRESWDIMLSNPPFRQTKIIMGWKQTEDV